MCPCAVDITVIFTFSCSFVCTGQHAALCVFMSQAVGSLRTASICGLHPTTSPMKALRSTSRCGDCCTTFGVDKILVSYYNWDDWDIQLLYCMHFLNYDESLHWLYCPGLGWNVWITVTLASSEIWLVKFSQWQPFIENGGPFAWCSNLATHKPSECYCIHICIINEKGVFVLPVF